MAWLFMVIPLFALQIHVVEHLILHLALVERIRLFQQSVGQRTLAVVDMGDNTEIAYVFIVQYNFSDYKSRQNK